MKLFALARYTKADKNFGTFENPLSGALFASVEGIEKGIDSYGLHLGTVVPVAGGDFTAAVYYVDGETDTLRDARGQGSYDLAYLGLSARYVYPLSKRTSVYMGAGYAEEKIDVKVDDAGTNSFKNKIGQAYAGITHVLIPRARWDRRTACKIRHPRQRAFESERRNPRRNDRPAGVCFTL